MLSFIVTKHCCLLVSWLTCNPYVPFVSLVPIETWVCNAWTVRSKPAVNLPSTVITTHWPLYSVWWLHYAAVPQLGVGPAASFARLIQNPLYYKTSQWYKWALSIWITWTIDLLETVAGVLPGIISASLSISIVSRVLMIQNIRLAHLCVGMLVCPESVLWRNGWLDLDAVWAGEWGRAWYRCIRFWWWSFKGKEQFWGWIWDVPL